ncbi:MAG: hypothetical protein LBR69_04495, partial [Endomicrobium sp.]|nr:hypothetical protein [Endomicrobium sp.]
FFALCVFTQTRKYYTPHPLAWQAPLPKLGLLCLLPLPSCQTSKLPSFAAKRPCPVNIHRFCGFAQNDGNTLSFAVAKLPNF